MSQRLMFGCFTNSVPAKYHRLIFHKQHQLQRSNYTNLLNIRYSQLYLKRQFFYAMQEYELRTLSGRGFLSKMMLQRSWRKNDVINGVGFLKSTSISEPLLKHASDGYSTLNYVQKHGCLQLHSLNTRNNPYTELHYGKCNSKIVTNIKTMHR